MKFVVSSEYIPAAVNCRVLLATTSDFPKWSAMYVSVTAVTLTHYYSVPAMESKLGKLLAAWVRTRFLSRRCIHDLESGVFLFPGIGRRLQKPYTAIPA